MQRTVLVFRFRDLLGPLALAICLMLESDAQAGGQGFCADNSQAGLSACRAGVKGDYWIAVVKCQNLPQAHARNDCLTEALAERGDGLETCQEEYQAHLAVCGGLGGTRYHPDINPADFIKGVSNRYFPLPPGRTLVYEGKTPEGKFRVEVTVTKETKEILGVTCIAVRDTVTMGGQLIEDTIDWHAQDKAGNVWYFGEESKGFVDGDLVTLEGSFLAGRDGAQPGIIMEAHPKVGDLYRQEYFPGEAEDVAKVLDLHKTVTVPAGTYDDCLKTKDFSPLEPDVVEHKYYAPGVGLVLEVQVKGGAERVELVQIK